jgi:hypothetical protein
MLSPRPFSFTPTFSEKWRPAVDTNYTTHSCCDADGTYGGDSALHLFACTPEFVTLLCGCCSRKAHSPAFQVLGVLGHCLEPCLVPLVLLELRCGLRRADDEEGREQG